MTAAPDLLRMSADVPPLFFSHEIFRHSRYGGKHPLSIPRVSTTLDLVRALGWLPPHRHRENPQATPDQLARFHTPDYLATLQQAEAAQSLPDNLADRYQIGRNGNPIFAEVYSRPATAAGGTLAAAKTLLAGGVAYNPAGGTHHGRPDRAAGFCYLNDPVLGLLAWRDAGLAPLLYVDLDAHHGDGVADAFDGIADVVTVSIHDAALWPRNGPLLVDLVRGRIDLPVPRGLHDVELLQLIDGVLLPLIERLCPAALMIQGGADGLADDPMSGLSLSNQGLWRAVARLRDTAPRLLVLGGGGYNPWSVARCWAGIWGVLTGQAVPDTLPSRAQAVLRGLSWRHRLGRNPPAHWFTTLADPIAPQPCRAEIRALAQHARSALTGADRLVRRAR